MKSRTSIIIAREYLERVRKKSFILTTLLFPLFMLAMMVIPSLIMIWSSDKEQKFTVVDASGVVGQRLESNEEVIFTTLDIPLDVALEDKTVQGVVYIPANVVKSGSGVKVYSSDAVSMPIEASIRSQITKIIEDERLKQYDIENLDKIMADVDCDLKMQTVRINPEGEEEASSSMVNYILGIVLDLFLYMALLLYGQMVMTSIIEEKNNRVLELIVSSVKPTQIMLGKIAGIGLVAVTQILIWLVLIVSMSAFLLPALMPAEVMTEVSAMNSGSFDVTAASTDIDVLQAVSILADPGYIMGLFAYLLLFTVGGFLFYAALNAAIGSAVDNIQDASQFQSVVMFPIIFGIIFGMQAASAPNSTLALITSFIPFTTPMVMMSRIPVGIPTWQIIVALVELFASVVFMIWLAAKIYRVGIFMYGKKPTFKELVRWARYK